MTELGSLLELIKYVARTARILQLNYQGSENSWPIMCGISMFPCWICTQSILLGYKFMLQLRTSKINHNLFVKEYGCISSVRHIVYSIPNSATLHYLFPGVLHHSYCPRGGSSHSPCLPAGGDADYLCPS